MENESNASQDPKAQPEKSEDKPEAQAQNASPSQPETKPTDTASHETRESEKPPRPPLPTPTVSELAQTFALQALIACGKIPNPLTKQYDTDPEMAEYQISILELLEEKTKGNLTEEEQKFLSDILFNARMAFMDAMKNKQP